jgi:hypothetical protein
MHGKTITKITIKIGGIINYITEPRSCGNKPVPVPFSHHKFHTESLGIQPEHLQSEATN